MALIQNQICRQAKDAVGLNTFLLYFVDATFAV